MNDTLSLFWQLTAVDEAPWVLSLLIILLGLYFWLQLKRRTGRLAQALDMMIANVQASDGPTTFKQRYGATFAELSANPMLGEVWRAYASTLTQDQSSTGSVGYTRRPRETFNEQVVTAVGINMRFYDAVPNLLVGLGLLFSFVGLVSALYFASSGVASESLDAAQAALSDLLAVATFKFMTSIAGLSASLLFSWAEKRQLYNIQHRLQRLCAALEARMVPVTSESLMLAQLERTRSIEQQVTRLSRAVYVRVPEALEDTLAEELRSALTPLHEAIAKAARDFTIPSPQISEFPTENRAPSFETQTPSAASNPVGAPERITELAAMADSRFNKAIEVISSGLERVRIGNASSFKAKAAALEQTLEQSLDRLRDTRQTVRAMHEALDTGDLGIQEAMAALEAVDQSLVKTREELRHAGREQP